MKLKYNFIVNEVAGSKVAVAVGDDAAQFNGFIKMNDTGAEIFALLKNERTLDSLLGEMLKIYSDSEPEVIKLSIEDFVSKLKEAEVLE